MCFCLITICFHMPNVFYLFVALLLICQRWPMIGFNKSIHCSQRTVVHVHVNAFL